jgi:DNA or RNA helicases of superfamily II
MNREETEEVIVNSDKHFILAELPTGFGKSKVALSRMDKLLKDNSNPNILIVIPRLVLIQNWINEFKKWGYEKYLKYTKFVTYVSFPKKVGKYDLIIFDEVHHFSKRCQEAYEDFKVKEVIMLSATISRAMRESLNSIFTDLYTCKISIKSAIKEEVLPDPKVYLIPMVLDNTKVCCEIIKNKHQKIGFRIPYSKRYEFAKVKNRRIIIECTQQQYYDDLSSLISWYKNKMFSEFFKNMFLRKSGDRIIWLSQQKTKFVKSLLDNLLQNQRTLTFCNGIPQTEELGKYCINSKNKESENNLAKFNLKKIKHITACNMLDEGANLTNCRVGVYATLNSSERMITQKLGRLLRHPNPIIIIPYFKNTRDEEIVNKMMENYNPELVTVVTDLNQIIL